VGISPSLSNFSSVVFIIFVVLHCLRHSVCALVVE